MSGIGFLHEESKSLILFLQRMSLLIMIQPIFLVDSSGGMQWVDPHCLISQMRRMMKSQMVSMICISNRKGTKWVAKFGVQWKMGGINGHDPPWKETFFHLARLSINWWSVGTLSGNLRTLWSSIFPEFYGSCNFVSRNGVSNENEMNEGGTILMFKRLAAQSICKGGAKGGSSWGKGPLFLFLLGIYSTSTASIEEFEWWEQQTINSTHLCW